MFYCEIDIELLRSCSCARANVHMCVVWIRCCFCCHLCSWLWWYRFYAYVTYVSYLYLLSVGRWTDKTSMGHNLILVNGIHATRVSLIAKIVNYFSTLLVEIENHRLINVNDVAGCWWVYRSSRAMGSLVIWIYRFVSIVRWTSPYGFVRSHRIWVCRVDRAHFRFDSDATNRLCCRQMDVSNEHRDDWIRHPVCPIHRFAPSADRVDRMHRVSSRRPMPYSIGPMRTAQCHSWWSYTCLWCLGDNLRPPGADRPNEDRIPADNWCTMNRTSPKSHVRS